jgi:hypothetical protein
MEGIRRKFHCSHCGNGIDITFLLILNTKGTIACNCLVLLLSMIVFILRMALNIFHY